MVTTSLRKPLIIANWKMHHTIGEALAFVTAFTHELKAYGPVELGIAPPFTALYSLGIALAETDIQLAAQNLFWEEKGAFTGEVSGNFLKEVGCRFVIVGHSERRQFFHETNETVNKRTIAALRAELIPIFCVGETLAERSSGKTWEVIEQQLKEGLNDIPLAEAEDFVVAYEPVWAIGTGKTASPSEANEVHLMIRNWLSKEHTATFGKRTRILYGGSVTPANSRELFLQPEIDGALVGSASLSDKKFADIVRNLP